MDPKTLLASPCCKASPGGRPWTRCPPVSAQMPRSSNKPAEETMDRKPTSHRTWRGRLFLPDCPWESEG